MKHKTLTIALCLVTMVFLISCSDHTITQSDQALESSTLEPLAKPGKVPPSKDDQPPVVSFWVDNDPVPTLPGQQVTVHYHITDDVDISKIDITILCDDHPDLNWNIMCATRVYMQTIEFPGTEDQLIEDTFTWNGQVFPNSSSSGYLFDQYAMNPNPDVYLLIFEVFDGSHIVYNWIGNDSYDLNVRVEENAKILVNPANTMPPFSVSALTAEAVTPKKAKGKYVAELIPKVVTTLPIVMGMGQWFQVFADGSEGKILFREGTPYVQLVWDSQGYATRRSPLLVGPGTYRFYVKSLMHPDYSYNPYQNTNWIWPEEPNVTVTVE